MEDSFCSLCVDGIAMVRSMTMLQVCGGVNCYDTVFGHMKLEILELIVGNGTNGCKPANDWE
jgi:hypothetical protein